MSIREYQEFDLLVDEPLIEAGLLRGLSVRLLGSPVGDHVASSQALDEVAAATLAERLRGLERRELGQDGVIDLGEMLAALILPGGIRAMLAESLGSLADGEGLRVRLRLHPTVAEIPWEYLWVARQSGLRDATGFLALYPVCSIVRHEPVHGPMRQSTDARDRRVVAVFADPTVPGGLPLDLDRERANLERALSAVPHVALVPVPVATIDGVSQALDAGADVFHFAGHGEVDQLFLVDAHDGPAPVPASQLAVNLADRGVQLAVLGACESGGRAVHEPWSGVASGLIAVNVPAVVAMQYRIGDEAAIGFSERFYLALAAGLSLDEAVAAGRLAVYNLTTGGQDEAWKAHLWRDWGVPVLYARPGARVSLAIPDEADRARATERIEVSSRQRVTDVEQGGTVIGVEIGSMPSGTVRSEVKAQHVRGTVVGVRIDDLTGGRVDAVLDTGSVTGEVVGVRIGTVGGRVDRGTVRQGGSVDRGITADDGGDDPGVTRRGGGLERGPVTRSGDARPRDTSSMRFVSTVVRDEDDAILARAFRANALNHVMVDIGPPRDDEGRSTATGPESIDATLAQGQAHDLQILFEIPDLSVAAVRRLSLPPAGTSEPVRFSFQAPAPGSTVNARISALHANRVLQTAELRGVALADPATAPSDQLLDLRLATIRPGTADLESRTEFDVALLAGRDEAGRTVATAVRNDQVARFDDDGISKASDRIIELLTRLADHPEDYQGGLESPRAVELLRALAFEGRALHDVLGQGILEQLPAGDLARLQVVADAEDLVPVEFIYDAPVPTLEAGLCANWRTALSDGACPDTNHVVDGVTGAAAVVCPAGFWAIRTVVERQLVTAMQRRTDLRDSDFAIMAAPSRDRPSLPAFSAGLFAASRKVRVADAAAVESALAAATGGHGPRVTTWKEWIERVAGDRPTLLVLLAHSSRSKGPLALEIEESEQLPLVAISNSFVGPGAGGPPVVLLLGCETATADKDLQSFVGRIKTNGAAIVVGTIAPVLGQHAGPVGRALIDGLHRSVTGDRDAAGATFGDVMLHLRRRLLADGHLMALCLTSFGDADWQLPGGTR